MRTRDQIKLLHRLTFDKRVLNDEHGVIVVPTELKYKCGWGPTLGDAVLHCAKRNGRIVQP